MTDYQWNKFLYKLKIDDFLLFLKKNDQVGLKYIFYLSNSLIYNNIAKYFYACCYYKKLSSIGFFKPKRFNTCSWIVSNTVNWTLFTFLSTFNVTNFISFNSSIISLKDNCLLFWALLKTPISALLWNYKMLIYNEWIPLL